MYNTGGLDLMKNDWDICTILDACRYDMFSEQSTLPGGLSKRVSRGSSTLEFLRGNFSSGMYHDTVYVSANPQFRRYNDRFEAEFYDVIDVWESEGWNKEYNTVLPSTTAEYAIEANEKYPNKRLLIHFIQPHYPFLNTSSKFDKTHLHNTEGTDDFWLQLFYGELDISTETIWSLYYETLNKTLPHVQNVLETITGKHVVTADHGNIIGERSYPIPIREWGHPDGIHVPQLIEVPWLEFTNGTRREIVSERPNSTDRIENDIAKERLRTLGYRE